MSETEPLCKCGRGPWRPGQKNCRACNREAGRAFRKRIEALGMTNRSYRRIKLWRTDRETAP
jgi:hypothetical protein